MKKQLALGFSGLTIVAIGLLGTAGTAAAACAQTNLRTGLQKQGSTVNVSTTSTCNDLNLTRADDSHNGAYDYDSYAGFYFKTSTRSWVMGASGYHLAFDFTASSPAQWIVLLTDIGNGALVGVGSLEDGGDLVTVAH